MKHLSIFIIVLIILFIPGSCEKDKDFICGVKQPEMNISWLRDMINNASFIDVYQFSVADTQYIEIADPPGPDSGSQIFDCEGNFKCELGGYLPGDNLCNLTCPPELFLPAYTNKKLIYSKRAYN